MGSDFGNSNIGLFGTGAPITDVHLLVGDLPVFKDGLMLKSKDDLGLVLGMDILSRMAGFVISTRRKKMYVPTLNGRSTV